MSYEGYVEHLCKNGHYWTIDVYQDYHSCPHCTEESVWKHSVDCTNGEVELEDGTIHPDTTQFPLEVERTEPRVIEINIYRIPKDNPTDSQESQ